MSVAKFFMRTSDDRPRFGTTTFGVLPMSSEFSACKISMTRARIGSFYTSRIWNESQGEMCDQGAW
ncbi:unnamed protein product [Periconia digitata]|uniref:Uncharacterized protein n=1 Tax=Periconia digitata TaxID=1303443 RepID=A0A9W4XQZ7_9PLEO|nr:unnamed protein product [Periconia digitata]